MLKEEILPAAQEAFPEILHSLRLPHYSDEKNNGEHPLPSLDVELDF